MAIEIRNLRKSFGGAYALDDVTLSFGDNKIYGLLGNNGAGKTTLLNIITGRYLADSGQVLVDGLSAPDNDAALGQIYMLGEKRYYPDNMRVKEALGISGWFYPDFDAAYAAELAERFQLPLKKKITALSTGYASIFKIVVALAVNTPYLLLDEPVLGLDAQHRDMFYKALLVRYAERPSTIVISTHLIAEVANIIEHTVIIRAGRIIRDAPQETLPSGPQLEQANLQDYFIQLMNEEETK